MAKNSAAAKWQQSLIVLTNLAIAVVVVGALYWAQVVFIPLGMALFLTFLLTPIVRSLQRRGLGRTPSVLIVVLGTAPHFGRRHLDRRAATFRVIDRVAQLQHEHPGEN